MISSHISRVMFSTRGRGLTPAALTRMSGAPKGCRGIVCGAVELRAIAQVADQRMARPPAGTNLATALPRPAVRDRGPAAPLPRRLRPASSAMRLPMPELAPVTSATRPCTRTALADEQLIASRHGRSGAAPVGAAMTRPLPPSGIGQRQLAAGARDGRAHLLRRRPAEVVARLQRALQRQHLENVVGDQRREALQLGERQRGEIPALLGSAKRTAVPPPRALRGTACPFFTR